LSQPADILLTLLSPSKSSLGSSYSQKTSLIKALYLEKYCLHRRCKLSFLLNIK